MAFDWKCIPGFKSVSVEEDTEAESYVLYRGYYKPRALYMVLCGLEARVICLPKKIWFTEAWLEWTTPPAAVFANPKELRES